ncbi:MSMEG_0570 family nitrogen starvation response protein [Pseudomonas sp. Q11]|uniref:MSMEG_0570 family nitrogen starvation response protein n=1 Tax=Pseudomonas sp. Q11 TaxID=2968470 RepID=UPI00210C3C68|nr:MSMEG_0570 family nitrogen starvation response protein [Pseudomonas sp. Q11]MCQ6256712.1 MSMEG_0570 family nitrogen starvation response protein [Pseudomonas sp. Q11]
MPAVNIRLRWPDGQESNAYSPSTIIHEHLQAGKSYPMEEFLHRAETGLNSASERVRVVKGFYCSAAMDTLGGLRLTANKFTAPQAQVQVLEIKTQGAGQVNYAGFADI